MSPDGFLADVLAAPKRLAGTLAAYSGRGSPFDLLPATPPDSVLLIGMVTVVSVGAEVAGAAAAVTYPHAGNRAVATLVETGVAELLAAELWRRAPEHSRATAPDDGVASSG